MQNMIRHLMITALSIPLLIAGYETVPVRAADVTPKIEVSFVLDTTGSMGQLIGGAKQKIWTIARQVVAGRPTPAIKLGLIGSRDRGDQYVTKVFDLSDDLDAVSSARGAAPDDGPIRFVGDPRVGSGGCQVETPSGFIDAGIAAQIREVLRAFHGDETQGRHGGDHGAGTRV